MSSAYDAALAPLGVTVAQYSLLTRIGGAAALSLSELGARLELDRSTVGRNVRVLERMGLVRIETGEDQREAALSLTGRAERLLADALPRWQAAQRKIETKLGADAETLLRILDSF